MIGSLASQPSKFESDPGRTQPSVAPANLPAMAMCLKTKTARESYLVPILDEGEGGLQNLWIPVELVQLRTSQIWRQTLPWYGVLAKSRP